MPKFGITSGLPQLPVAVSDKDNALVSPLYRAVNSLADKVAVAVNSVQYSQAELAGLAPMAAPLRDRTNIVTVFATEALPYGSLVNITPVGARLEAKLASKATDDFAHGCVASPAGIAVNTYGDVQFMAGICAGVTGSTWGVVYYLGTAGAMQSTQPTGASGDARQVVALGMGQYGIYLQCLGSDMLP